MKKNLYFVPVVLVLCGVVIAAEYPQWFETRGVINAEQPTNDYAPANQGHVKWVAAKAYEEFVQKLPSADLSKLQAVIYSFPDANNYKPANLGMLKAVATPFYDELIAAGHISDYPWADGLPADYNLANQGQLKNLFAFNLDVDLDSDGLVDWWANENNVSGGDADTDGDGLTNEQEYELGLEYKGFYQLVDVKMTWHEACSNAVSRGGHLVTITSAYEHQQVTNALGADLLLFKRPWIGATDENQEGVWEWVTGEMFDYSQWDVGEPNNAGGLEHYAQLWDNTDWNDAKADGLKPYILEYSTVLDPTVADSDGDGVLDGDEIALGSNPLSTDSDGDGLTDGEEVAAGSSPVLVDTDNDGFSDFKELRIHLTDPLKYDTDGDGLPDGDEISITLTSPLNPDTDNDTVLDMELVASVAGANTYDRYDGHVSSYWTTVGDGVELSLLRTYAKGSYVMYEINVATAGVHHLSVDAHWANSMPAVENCAAMRFYMDGILLNTVQVVANDDGTGSYVIYTPWLAEGRHLIKCNPLPVNNKTTAGFTIDALNLYAIDGLDADGNGIQDWMEAMLATGADTDGDGIADQLEVISTGTDPLKADSDGDGLDDNDEINVYMTDPALADTDGDGVSDGEEVNQVLSDPLVADFGDSSVITTVAGAAYSSSIGEWYVEGSSIYAATRNGSLDYNLSVPSNGNYVLEIEVAQHSSYVLDSSFDISLSINGTGLGNQTIAVSGTATGTLKFWLPGLSAGSHAATLDWNNIYAGSSLQVNELRLLSYGGPDNNANGVADWLDSRLENLADAVDADPGSFVSPVCLEGSAHYLEEIRVDADFAPNGSTQQVVSVQDSLGNGWYANVMLSPDAATAMNIDYGSGLPVETVSVDWDALNLMNLSTNSLTIRLNDALLLEVGAGLANGGAMIVVNGPSGAVTNLAPAGISIPVIFEEAGEYAVSGFYSTNAVVQVDPASQTNAYGFVNGMVASGSFSNGLASVSNLTVKVVDARFASDPYIANKSRKWSCPSIPSDMVVEYEAGLTLSSKSLSGGGTEFTLNLLSRSEQKVIARIGKNGPIADRATAHPLVFDNGNYWKLVTTYPDGTALAMYQIALSDVPEDLAIEMSVITAGTTFDDGSLSKTLTADDFNEEGVATYYMIRSETRDAVCHRVRIEQDGTLITNL